MMLAFLKLGSQWLVIGYLGMFLALSRVVGGSRRRNSDYFWIGVFVLLSLMIVVAYIKGR